jgi:predicted metal-dependent hydrolase
VIPTPPLRVRDRLARTIVAALHDPDARRELTALAADPPGSPGWIDDDGLALETARTRARAAMRALAGRGEAGGGDALDRALADAAMLFDAGLFFEVHELLEPFWLAATGEARQALQGLIQVAVGYQHRANGNLAGARALLADGVARLRGRRIRDRPLEDFAQRVRASLGALDDLTEAAIPAFPRTDDGASMRERR